MGQETKAALGSISVTSMRLSENMRTYLAAVAPPKPPPTTTTLALLPVVAQPLMRPMPARAEPAPMLCTN